MATKLKNMRLTSVDLVRNGANQEADICLFKSADPAEAPAEAPTEAPTESETNIIKRFINRLRKNSTEGEYEPENPIEKADEQPDLADIYKSALTVSLQSIAADETLTADEKNDMIAKSLNEYHEAMVDLLAFSEPEDEVGKANPYHDALGRFTTGGGGSGGAAMSSKDAEAFMMQKDPNLKKVKVLEVKRTGDGFTPGTDRYMIKYEGMKDMQNGTGLQEVKRTWSGDVPIGKSYEIDEIEDGETVEKFNPYHGADGRFTTANGGGGGGVRRRNIDEETDEILAIERELAGSRSSGRSEGGASAASLNGKKGKELKEGLANMPVGTELTVSGAQLIGTTPWTPPKAELVSTKWKKVSTKDGDRWEAEDSRTRMSDDDFAKYATSQSNYPSLKAAQAAAKATPKIDSEYDPYDAPPGSGLLFKSATIDLYDEIEEV